MSLAWEKLHLSVPLCFLPQLIALSCDSTAASGFSWLNKILLCAQGKMKTLGFLLTVIQCAVFKV